MPGNGAWLNTELGDKAKIMVGGSESGTQWEGHKAAWASPRIAALATISATAMLFYFGTKYQYRITWTFDWPIMLKINSWVSPFESVNEFIEDLSDSLIFTGAFIITLIWYSWSIAHDAIQKQNMLLGFGGSVAAVVVSRVLQMMLPAHLRPVHDPAPGYIMPAGFDPTGLHGWSSFPSDHAAIYFALATVVWRQSRRLGVWAGLSALFATLPRLYLGIHFPSDVIFGALLGVVIAWSAEVLGPHRLAARVVSWEDGHRGAFYAIGFLVSVELATLFGDVRLLGSGLRDLLRAHPW